MRHSKIAKLIKKPLFLLVFLNNRGLHLINDEKYVKLMHLLKTNNKCDLENPKTYNEKLQWLKLHDRKDIYTTMVDKYEAKQYVTNAIGDEYVIPTIGIYDSFEEINFNSLPDQFVIKCTHDSGGTIICRDKSELDLNKVRKRIKKCLKRNYYWSYREWPYKNLKPRIIVEKYLEDSNEGEIRDYKFFCFDGKIGVVLVCTNRQTDLEETWFDEDFNLLDLREGGHKNRKDLIKPKNYSKMKSIAKKLSKGIPHVRVDLYDIDGRIYFGELTFYPAGGYEIR